MADTKTRVDGPVSIKSDSAERVALELYHHIRLSAPEQQDEALELFARCLYHTRDHYRSVAEVKKLLKQG
ncbi:hypothetical protein [Methylobacterium sp. E-066]|uniref:hypothetical protein n=1 Tax=Methylobacterium sp. E-066 TaxID=2836584 RepID=UPI001FBACA10|nr:hypothetical protein [Methylobacterium sp. E-066]MCJ2142158.1 hypothetical protein [Methylobacterium sp. E-066]